MGRQEDYPCLRPWEAVLNQIDEGLPGRNRLHWSKKSLSLGSLLHGALLVTSEGEALRAAVADLFPPINPASPSITETLSRGLGYAQPESHHTRVIPG